MQKVEKRDAGMRDNFRTLFLFVALFLTFALPVSANILDEANPVTIVSRDISVRGALEQVKKQSGVSLMYQSDIINDQLRLNLNLKQASLKEALDAICTPAGLKYVLKESYVLITKAREAGRQPLSKRRIHGMVVDEKGEPLIGAAVYIESTGLTSGVITDYNGHYELEATPEDLLIFSFVGMAKQAVAIGKNVEINVTLREDSQMLNDVVVTGFQTISKERATGAFDIVNQDVLDKPSVTIADRLVGKVAGVQTSTTADGNISFTIRGSGTFQSDAEPLVVVDGFPISTGMVSINPNDVESISILKDAAAASIWGARASNGVIVITTKKGNKNKGLNVEVDAQLRFGSNTDVDYLRNMMSSAETVDYQKSMFGNYKTVRGNPTSTPESKEAFKSVYESVFTQAGALYNQLTRNEITADQYASGLSTLSKLDNKQQIEDELLQRPVYQQYNVTLSGSNSRMVNYISLLYGYDTTRYKGSDSRDFQFNYRGSVSLLKWLDMNMSATVLYDKNRNSGVSASDISGLAPYDMLLNEDGSYTDMSYSRHYLPGIKHTLSLFSFPYSDWGYNPVQEVNGRDVYDKSMSNRFQVGLKAKILEGLTFDTKFQYEHILSDVRSLYSDQTYQVRNYINSYTSLDWDTHTATAHIDKGSILYREKYTTDAYNWRNQVNFVRTFADRHAINFVGGIEIMQNKWQGQTYAPAYAYDDHYLTSHPITETVVENCTGDTPVVGIDTRSSFSYTMQRYFSAFANVAYTYDDKYSISGSYRTDASNFITDDPKYRYSPFWSVGLSWNMMHEEFMKPVSWINSLRPRITYGCNGNANTSTSVVPLIAMNGISYITGEPIAEISTSGNPKMSWERTHVVNVGVDWVMFGGKFFGKVDFYNKKGTDILANISVPMASGQYKSIWDQGVKITANAAEVTNRGFELELGTDLPIGKGFNWNGSVTMAYNKNKVDKFYVNFIEHNDMRSSMPVEGYSIHGLWAYEYAGLKEMKAEDGSTYHVPTIKTDDEGNTSPINVIPKTTDGRDAMKYMGTRIAPWTVGTSHTFSYKEWNLSFTMIGKFGHKFRATGFNYADPLSSVPNRQYNQLQSKEVMPLPDNKIISLSEYSAIAPYMDYNVKSANHVRMQEVTLSYSLPGCLLNKWGIGRLTFYLQGNNLFTIKATDEDPEFAYGGLRLQPSYTIGAKFSY